MEMSARRAIIETARYQEARTMEEWYYCIRSIISTGQIRIHQWSAVKRLANGTVHFGLNFKRTAGSQGFVYYMEIKTVILVKPIIVVFKRIGIRCRLFSDFFKNC